MSTNSLIWYVARAGGLRTSALLTLTVLWGLSLSTKAMRRWIKPAWLLDLHRGLAGLTLVFLGILIAAILMDTYVKFGLVDVLIPFAITWHPGPVAWGIAGFYLLIAVEITSLIRTRIPLRLWRWVHYATLPLFAVATVHGFTAGTDRRSMAIIFAGAAGIVCVASLLFIRFAKAGGMLPSAARGGPAAVAAPRSRAVGH